MACCKYDLPIGAWVRINGAGNTFCICGHDFPTPYPVDGVADGRDKNGHRFILDDGYEYSCPMCGDIFKIIVYPCGGNFYWSQLDVESEVYEEIQHNL